MVEQTTATFRPGSWEMLGSPTGAGPITIRECKTNGLYIAELVPTASDPPAEVLANARLIAAAPDLLAACEAIAMGDTTAGHVDLGTAIKMAHDAVAKARGGVTA